MQERQATEDFRITLHGWGSFGDDDMGSLYRWDAVPPHGFNLQRVCSPEFDRLNDATLVEVDPDKRRELLIAQGNVVNDAAHLGILFFRKGIYAAQPRVRNFFANYYSHLGSLPWLWLDDRV